MNYTVVMIPSAMQTRVLVSHGPDELMRARLPPPSQVRHRRAVISWLEGMSLWLDAKLHVALFVEVRAAGSCLGLTDELGVEIQSLYFELEVLDPAALRRRGQRIRGVGDFADLRQLRLLWMAAEGA
jgi:hypothetical protein